MKQAAFKVLFSESLAYPEETVYFDGSMSADEVKKSLIDHDGYPADIIVERRP